MSTNWTASDWSHCSSLPCSHGAAWWSSRWDREARGSDGRRVKFAPDTTFREFAVASTLTFAVIFIATESLGLVLVLATAALIIGLRSLFHRWLDGINDTVMDATCELTQLVTLAILALF